MFNHIAKATERRQAIFNYVWNFLKEQREPSRVSEYAALDGNVCMYKSPEGKKCAIGCMITEDQYDPSMEGKDIRSSKISHLFHQDDLLFLQSLQWVHDSWEPVPKNNKYKFTDMADRLRNIARDYNLTAPTGEEDATV